MRRAVPSLLLTAALAVPAAAQTATGITFGGDVYDVDLTTGATTLVGSTGRTDGNQLAAAPDGTLYAVLDDGDLLVTIDPATGAATAVGAVGLAEVRGLAAHPTNGLLYALVDASVVAGAFDEIWTIDPAGPTTQVLGSTGRVGIQALDFAPGGTLYGWDLGGFPPNGDGLVTIDLVSGSANAVDGNLNNGWVYQWMVVLDDATAIVGVNDTAIVDLTTGATTLAVDLGVTLQGVDLRFGAIGSPACTGTPNSSGGPAVLSVYGSPFVATNALELAVTGLPTDQFGIFVMGDVPGSIPVGQGVLCLGLPFVRFPTPILDSGSVGAVSMRPDLTALPSMTVIAPGDTWAFQYWTRDVNPAPTSNLSGAVAVTFQ